jgi:hypothetical protein
MVSYPSQFTLGERTNGMNWIESWVGTRVTGNGPAQTLISVLTELPTYNMCVGFEVSLV